MTNTIRVCKKCGDNKSILDFAFRDGNHKYRRHSCIKCWNKYQNSRYDLGKTSHYRTNFRNKARQFVLDYLKTHTCIECPETEPCCLDFDHVRGKKFSTIKNMVGNCFSIEKIKLEIAKCEVRCSNCHRKKTAKDFNWYKDLKR